METVAIDVRYEERTQQPGLRYGIIEVTTKCQCACPGCYMVRRSALNKGEMTLNQAVRVLDLCRDYIGTELETMDILGGEPLLWPHLKEYIEVLIGRGILPWIFTNMLAITPELARWLHEREIHVTGKLNVNPDDSTQFALQGRMLGRSTEIAKRMIGTIGTFQGAGYRAPLFRLQNLIRKSNIHLAPEYYRWCLMENIGTDLELMGSGEEVGEGYWKVAPTPEQIARMIEEIQKIRQQYGLEPAEVLMPHVFGACPFNTKGLYFAGDGHIRACSNSTMQLAHLDDVNPIRVAYESELICNRCSLTQERVGEPCHSCAKWSKCRGGCRATVEGMGDANGGYFLCPLPYLRG